MLVANAQAALTAMLPKPEEMPVDGGVIAIVGPSGSGKTRVVAALAAAYGRQGFGVTVARLRGTQRDDELAELLEGEEVDLIPPMTIRATVREVEAARGDLVILDTPATRVGDAWGVESLAETLARFLPDGVLLCTPATFTQKALAKLVEHHTPLQVDGLVATHYDQAGMLGTVVELAIETRIPLGHVHSGLDVADAISAVDPHGLAGDLVR
jgi:flagellar biosynthesis protein FlhF